MSICPDDNKFKSYCNYLTDTFISEESIFPPTIWVSGSSDFTRTTNACESIIIHILTRLRSNYVLVEYNKLN